jgi:hypothetical protein
MTMFLVGEEEDRPEMMKERNQGISTAGMGWL